MTVLHRGAWEFNKKSVSHCFNNSPPVAANRRIHKLRSQFPKESDRTFLVRCCEAGISDNVCDHNRGQLSLGRRGGHGIRFRH